MSGPLLPHLIHEREPGPDQSQLSIHRVTAICWGITATITRDADSLLLAPGGPTLFRCHRIAPGIRFLSLLREHLAREPGTVEALIERGFALASSSLC